MRRHHTNPAVEQRQQVRLPLCGGGTTPTRRVANAITASAIDVRSDSTEQVFLLCCELLVRNRTLIAQFGELAYLVRGVGR
jgi:hypothetical protein